VRVDPERRPEADHPQLIGGRAEDDVLRHHAVGDATLLAVDVAQEQVERAHTLRDARLDLAPLGGADHARHQREREQPLAPAVRHGEGRADIPQLDVRAALAIGERGFVPRREAARKAAIRRPHRAGRIQQLVGRASGRIVVREWRHNRRGRFAR
jgi:hypothetical protein